MFSQPFHIQATAPGGPVNDNLNLSNALSALVLTTGTSRGAVFDHSRRELRRDHGAATAEAKPRRHQGKSPGRNIDCSATAAASCIALHRLRS